MQRTESKIFSRALARIQICTDGMTLVLVLMRIQGKGEGLTVVDASPNGIVCVVSP